MWNKLKYGLNLELGVKIPEITFCEDSYSITLYGVIPLEISHSKIWAGRLFECSVDHFGVLPNE